MTFQIYNGPAYKGYVRVENVHDNMCSALIVGEDPGTDSSASNLIGVDRGPATTGEEGAVGVAQVPARRSIAQLVVEEVGVDRIEG